MKKIYVNKKLIILIICIVLLIILLLNFINNKEKNEEEITFNKITRTKEITIKENESFYVDIKGNVKNPGVYEIKENNTIQDIINESGGLKKNSYTKNINLSKKVTDEMVIYIFTIDEINKAKKINNCECIPIYKYIECNEENKTTTTTTTSKNIEKTTITTEITKPITTTEITKPITTTKITTAKLTTTTTNNLITEEIKTFVNINTADLETLSTLNGLGVKKAQSIIEHRNEYGLFKKIEDIMNVKGIGESTFEKIKEYIEV